MNGRTFSKTPRTRECSQDIIAQLRFHGKAKVCVFVWWHNWENAQVERIIWLQKTGCTTNKIKSIWTLAPFFLYLLFFPLPFYFACFLLVHLFCFVFPEIYDFVVREIPQSEIKICFHKNETKKMRQSFDLCIVICVCLSLLFFSSQATNSGSCVECPRNIDGLRNECYCFVFCVFFFLIC